MILEAATDPQRIPKSTEALMFAIYISSVTSMDDQDCRKVMGEARSDLLAKLSNAMQQALVNAESLKSTNLVVLQALTLYLVSISLHLPLLGVRSSPYPRELKENLSIGKA